MISVNYLHDHLLLIVIAPLDAGIGLCRTPSVYLYWSCLWVLQQNASFSDKHAYSPRFPSISWLLPFSSGTVYGADLLCVPEPESVANTKLMRRRPKRKISNESSMVDELPHLWREVHNAVYAPNILASMSFATYTRYYESSIAHFPVLSADEKLCCKPWLIRRQSEWVGLFNMDMFLIHCERIDQTMYGPGSVLVSVWFSPH
jgi:hypothetical protein